MKYLLIGGGPASVSAAAMLRRLDAGCEITVLTREQYKPYSKMALPYYITDEMKVENLYLSLPEKVNIAVNQEAVNIDPERHQVETRSGDNFLYDKLLIATGGVPKKPSFEGVDLPFVLTIRDLPDVIKIKEILNGKKGRAVIAGAGPVSMEIGDALCKIGMDITFVISSKQVFSTMLDREAAEFMEKRLKKKGVEIRKGEDIVKIQNDGEVHFKSGAKLRATIVIIGKGVKPDIAFLDGSGIDVNKGIIVNEQQETNIPGIYAAGDVAETYDIASGEHSVNALWPAAEEQGRIAALNMAGSPVTYAGSLSRNILRVFGISVLSAGLAKADGPSVLKDAGKDYFHKIVLDDGTLKGFIFLGEVRNEGLYVSLLKRKIDVTAFSNSLLNGSYNYSKFMRSATSRRIIEC